MLTEREWKSKACNANTDLINVNKSQSPHRTGTIDSPGQILKLCPPFNRIEEEFDVNANASGKEIQIVRKCINQGCSIQTPAGAR